MLYDAGVTGFPLATSGQARALAVSSAQRSAVMPDVPTVAEAGFPEVEATAWFGVQAPARTPRPWFPPISQQATFASCGAALAGLISASCGSASPLPHDQTHFAL